MGAMRNKIACDAAVLQIKPRARRLPPGEIALWCQSQRNRVRRSSVTDKTQGAICSPLGARAATVSQIKPRARRLPPGDTALWFQSQQGCGHRVQCLK